MPDHSWHCVGCGEDNPPYTEVCRSCERPAPETKRVPPPGANMSEAKSAVEVNENRGLDFAVLFPEIIPGALFVVGTPLWFVVLISRGHYLVALASVAALVPIVVALIRLIKARRIMQADLAILLILLLAWWVAHVLEVS